MGLYRGPVGRHFDWSELVPDELQGRLTSADVVALRNLVWFLLDPLREALGVPLVVTSGFRDPETNRQVGGAPHSQHLYGEAADVVPRGLDIRVAAEAARALEPFKLGIYREHLHLAIPSRDLIHHREPAVWESDDA